MLRRLSACDLAEKSGEAEPGNKVGSICPAEGGMLHAERDWLTKTKLFADRVR